MITMVRENVILEPLTTTTALIELTKSKDRRSRSMSGCVFVSSLLVCVLLLHGSGSPSGGGGGGDGEDRLESLRGLTFTNVSSASVDFGRIRFSSPAAVVYPESVRDVEATVRAVRAGAGLTLAAKGRGHSVHGQAQVPRTISSSQWLILVFQAIMERLNLYLEVCLHCYCFGRPSGQSDGSGNHGLE